MSERPIRYGRLAGLEAELRELRAALAESIQAAQRGFDAIEARLTELDLWRQANSDEALVEK